MSYSLSAATGVVNALKDMITDAGNFDDVATVTEAIIFDLGDRRFIPLLLTRNISMETLARTFSDGGARFYVENPLAD